jgi:hypothetical protein
VIVTAMRAITASLVCVLVFPNDQLAQRIEDVSP